MRVGVAIGAGVGNVILTTPLISALATKHEVWICGKPDYSGSAELLLDGKLVKGWINGHSDMLFDYALETYMGHYGNVPNAKERLAIPNKLIMARGMHEADINLLQAQKLGIGIAPKAWAVNSDVAFPEYDYCIHAGCDPKCPSKRWQGFAQLAKTLYGSMAIVGTKVDDGMAWPSNCTSYVDKLSLVDTAALIKRCGIMIANDSGLMHLASALGVPTIGIFGPTSELKCRPYNSPYEIVRNAMMCSPCFLTDKYNKCKNRKCLATIHVQQVITAVTRIKEKIR